MRTTIYHHREGILVNEKDCAMGVVGVESGVNLYSKSKFHSSAVIKVFACYYRQNSIREYAVRPSTKATCSALEACLYAVASQQMSTSTGLRGAFLLDQYCQL